MSQSQEMLINFLLPLAETFLLSLINHRKSYTTDKKIFKRRESSRATKTLSKTCQAAGFCEDGNKLSTFITVGKCIKLAERLSAFQERRLLKKPSRDKLVIS